MENKNFLTDQIITYIGNKRKLLNDINLEVEHILNELGSQKGIMCDLFSGSGVVARSLKRYSNVLYVNDLEKYSCIINDCYLTNKNEFDETIYKSYLNKILNFPKIEGIITKNYAPENDNDIKYGERVFYTHDNAVIIDTMRTAINECVPDEYKKFYLAPLLYEASIHTNTSGIFKGFYKSKETGIGKFGGDGENSLSRICGKISLKKPIFSNYDCDKIILNDDANNVARKLKNLDITYLDPPYNQHPYSSNYFMLNTIVENKISDNLSRVSGIPDNWNKSSYNKRTDALKSFDDLISNLDSKYMIISYNNEGIISYDDMCSMLSKYGTVEINNIEYNTFKGSRNLKKRDRHTIEYLFVLKKDGPRKIIIKNEGLF